MKLAKVLEMLAPFGVHEDEVRYLLAQDTGWQQIMIRVHKTYAALLPIIKHNKKLEKQYNKLKSLKLRSIQKSPEQEAKERKETAEKFKNLGKENQPLGSNQAADFLSNIFGFNK